jgi:hypothetical protein
LSQVLGRAQSHFPDKVFVIAERDQFVLQALGKPRPLEHTGLPLAVELLQL